MSAAPRRSLLLLALLVGLCLTSCRALRLREAERAEQRGDYAAALECYKQLYQRLSPRERALRGRYARAQGRLALVLGQYERAYSLLSTALRLERDSLGLAAELGQAALSTARYEEAACWGQLLRADHPRQQLSDQAPSTAQQFAQRPQPELLARRPQPALRQQ